MTQEEKLVKLLQVANRNGFTNSYCISEDGIFFKKVSEKSLMIEYETNCWESLNDLVTNWEEGEVSFIEALCKDILDPDREMRYLASEVENLDEYSNVKEISFIEEIKIYWTLQPTSKRLEFLFTTFNHLLK